MSLCAHACPNRRIAASKVASSASWVICFPSDDCCNEPALQAYLAQCALGWGVLLGAPPVRLPRATVVYVHPAAPRIGHATFSCGTDHPPLLLERTMCSVM